ncbi:3-phosphoshikimate 1-carboxyvinyltransferase [Limosilactobacillus fermentum]|uniref:3-phosphoshikimate 1-carboxyvinyltransferase n=1 Tax=Limosilactobacillus fermentum TaxID=1613 RepID=UPI003B67B95E
MKKLLPARMGLHGSLLVPGDKSISHRAVMLGAISEGETEISHFLTGEDCETTIKAFQALGVRIEQAGTNVRVEGQGLANLKAPAQPLSMGNSGTTTRLIMGILAGSSFSTTLIGDQSLQRRPMRRVSEPLKEFGGEVQLTADGTLPATIIGHQLHGAKYEMKVASAQVKSALIFAALQAKQSSIIVEKLPTRNHTEIMLHQFGAHIRTVDNKVIIVDPGEKLVGQEVTVPGDMSSAAFFLVAATIVPHSKVTLKGVNLNPTRTGIIDILQQMGAKLSIEEQFSTGEPSGDITVENSALRPIHLTDEDIPAVIDELPLVALLAACSDGQSTIRGAQELRVKETDRIKTVVAELRKLGVQVKELPDGMVIDGRPSWDIQDPQLDSYGDHRLGMMDAIAALKADQPLQLAHEDAVAVSYPGFFADLATLLGGAHHDNGLN